MQISILIPSCGFLFVDSVGPIIYPLTKSLLQQNKFNDIPGENVDQQIVYPDIHGAAYHQINMMNADLLHQLGYKGQGIIVAMMDNGLIHADTMHYFDSVRPRILDTWDYVHNIQSIYTDILGGHGLTTFSCMAANVPYQFVGTAPQASFCLYQSEDNSAEWVMEEYHWAAAAERADSMGAQLFSTSLGYSQFDDGLGSHTYADLNGHKTVIAQAGNIAFSKGILVFNSAGNEGSTAWHYILTPADADSVLAIGAVDSARVIAAFSSFGPNSLNRVKPDLCAEGSSVYIVNDFGAIKTSGGTSFSCPILAGCAASLWSAFPDKSARDISNAIVISADRFWTPDSSYGYGIPNFYNAYLLLQTNYNGNILKVNEGITVFPNPFSSQLNVSVYADTVGTHIIQLFDISGKKVYEQEFTIRTKTFDILNLDGLSKLPAGEYELRYDSRKEYTSKVIKDK